MMDRGRKNVIEYFLIAYGLTIAFVLVRFRSGAAVFFVVLMTMMECMHLLGIKVCVRVCV